MTLFEIQLLLLNSLTGVIAQLLTKEEAGCWVFLICFLDSRNS
jgi:hypothetical protein